MPDFSVLQNFQEALRYIGKLPFEQAESNMKRYGKILMHHIPNETTELLKILCTDYRPMKDHEGSGLLAEQRVWAEAWREKWQAEVGFGAQYHLPKRWG